MNDRPHETEWAGAPLPPLAGPRGRLVPLKGLVRRLRAAASLASSRNIGKGIRRIARGELGLLIYSLRNLIVQRMALADAVPPRDVEYFEPAPETPNEPLVTIVIPCFNDGALVGEAVASALAQTFTDIEVIIVDGGSTDGTTPAVVASLAGPRVRPLIRTDGRHLPGDNRNFGIQAARGRIICCLDSDDLLDPTYVEKALFLLEYQAFDVVGTSLRMFGADDGEWKVPKGSVFDDLLDSNVTVVCALFRRTLWSRVEGFRDSGIGRDHVAEDWDFWFRLAAIGARFRNVSGEYLLNYRVRPRGTSMSSQEGTPNVTLQGQAIQRLNADLITPEARLQSRRQAARRLRPSKRDVAMCRSMRRATDAARRPTLLLAIPFFVVGGAERLLSSVVAGLTAAGWRVVVVSTEFDPPQAGDSLPWFSEKTAECYALPRFLPAEDWRDFVDYLIRSREPDALLIAGSRFFYDMLPQLAHDYPSMARLDLLFNTEGHVAKHLEHRAHLTGALCESRSVQDWLREKASWPEAALRCIPSGIDTAHYSPGPRPAWLAEELGIAPEDIVVGWSGRLSEEKSPETFIKLAVRCADLPGVHFVMTGGGPMAQRVAALVAKLPSDTRFHNRGLVDDIRDYYRLYDIYTLTSRLDGRPLAVMEAHSSGCAVLAARVGGVPDIMREGVTGRLAEPADVNDFERLLRGMLADRSALAAMRAAATGLARAEFSVTSMAEAYRIALSDAIAVGVDRSAR
jgi:glycosyltransferase involved in cell wall biosynthesis